MKAIVLHSGGLDSSTALYQAIADGAEEVLPLTITYGNKHATRERKAAAQVGNRIRELGLVNIPGHPVIQLPNYFGGGHSAVMGDVEMPLEEYRNYESGEGESITVVPFRNSNLISVAVTVAEVRGFDRVYAGMHATDHGAWAYPDCSPEFLGAMAAAIYVGTLHRVRLVFPFVWMTKTEVVTRAALLNVPLGLTYSCYQGRERHCGKCPTCLERIKAFVEAGYKDPAEYEIAVPEFEGLEVVW